jgi:hypothetical protein
MVGVIMVITEIKQMVDYQYIELHILLEILFE